MGYPELKIECAYESGVDNLVFDFYVPVLEQAVRYDRISGFFSSTSLALAARGLAGLIKNGGKMRLLTCPRLGTEDIEMMKQVVDNVDDIINSKLLSELDIENEFQNDHVAALGWMLAHDKLEIRIAKVYENGRLLTGEEIETSSIMHQKVGIMYDAGFNSLSFSGSNNESASGWLNNVEEFKVFCKWKSGQSEYYDKDHERFERLWEGHHPNVKVSPLDKAIRDKLIDKGEQFDVEKITLERYKKYVLRQPKPRTVNESITQYATKPKAKLQLFPYQQQAVDKWKSLNNSMLFEMATGCGKTRTATGCISEIIKIKKKLLVVISCPGNTLSVQWKNDISGLDIPVDDSIICDGTNPKWKTTLGSLIDKLKTGYINNLFIYTTHQTCSSEEFISFITDRARKCNKMFVGDEVHGMGADKAQNGLLPDYTYRVGLSATPNRWFDEDGTKTLTNYFGDDPFVFSIHDALTTFNPVTGKTFLVNFNYHPEFISLTDSELEEYRKLSERIRKMSNAKSEEQQEKREMLLFARANIEKAAFNKYEKLEEILDCILKEDGYIDDTIIFVSPEQIDEVLRILSVRNIIAHKFTKDESTAPSQKYSGKSERDYIIDMFKQKKYQVLVAIKCLDEGIDIPSAKRAIVMASSTNPREYVQRIGRVIRQAPDKNYAEIFDMILKPDLSNAFTEEFRDMERKIFNKELDRVLELSKEALNNAKVYKEVFAIKERSKK